VIQSMIERDGKPTGIQLIRWNHPTLYGFGMHRKIVIIDHETPNASTAATILGGRNFGDVYFHQQTKPDTPELDKWRDTDMIVTGSSTTQAAHIFRDALGTVPGNAGHTLVSSQGMTHAIDPGNVAHVDTTDKFAIVDQNPSSISTDSRYLDPVYKITLKMVANAQRSIDISNAYYIITPPLHDALVEAMHRGVQVRVHTNSVESMDAEDKPLLGAINGSLVDLVNHRTTR